MNIKEIVNNPKTKAGHAFDLFFQALIFISLVSHASETVPDLKVYQHFFDLGERIIVTLFCLEYLLRVYAAPKKNKFIFSFFGLVDLFAIAPFFLSGGGADFRFLRAFRLLRILKLFRYSDAINRFAKAFASIKNELIVFWAMTVVTIYIASAGIYYFESEAQPQVFKSMFHAMWWAVATLTTVGYGDIYPVTLGGKIFTFFVLMIGLGIVAVPAALMASALMKKDE
jgi:voltage-gated potassium channel